MTGIHGTTLSTDKISEMSVLNGYLVQIINVSKNGALVGSTYLTRGNGDNDYNNKLVILSDGFDPGNTRKIQDIVTDPKFKPLVNPNKVVGNYSPLAYGYAV